jgi:hypothetical protein
MDKTMVRVPEGYGGTMRVAIAGEWSVPDFAELMSQIQFLTGMTIFLTVDGRVRDEASDFFKRWERFWPKDKLHSMQTLPRVPFNRSVAAQFRVEFQQLMEGMKANYALDVEKVQFASPGSIDLVGFGAIVEQVRLFIKDVLDRRDSKQSRKIQDEIAKQDLLQKQIENAERLVKLRRSSELDDPRIRLLLACMLNADEFFSEKATMGQVIAIQKAEVAQARA